MRAISCAAMIVLSSVSAAAQTIRPFVEAGALTGRDHTWGQPIATGGVLVGGGIRLGRDAQLRLDVDLTPATDVAIGPTCYYSGLRQPSGRSHRLSTRL